MPQLEQPSAELHPSPAPPSPEKPVDVPQLEQLPPELHPLPAPGPLLGAVEKETNLTMNNRFTNHAQ